MAIPNKSPLKFWRKWSVGISRDCPNCFGYSLLSRERVKLRTSNLASTFTGPIRIKADKNFGEKGAWAYPGAAEIFWVPPTDFKFCKNIHRVDRNKSP